MAGTPEPELTAIETQLTNLTSKLTAPNSKIDWVINSTEFSKIELQVRAVRALLAAKTYTGS